MFKKLIYFILLLFFITSSTYKLEAQDTAGYIKTVDLTENAVLINNNWYLLSGSSEIFRNGQESSLQAVSPIEDGFCQWGKIIFNNRGKVAKLKVYYQVYEGEVVELSHLDRAIKVSLYRGDKSSLESEYFYWSDDIINNEEMDLLKKGNHIVFIAAQNIIIHLPNP